MGPPIEIGGNPRHTRWRGPAEPRFNGATDRNRWKPRDELERKAAELSMLQWGHRSKSVETKQQAYQLQDDY